jgi:hypothetical protein
LRRFNFRGRRSKDVLRLRLIVVVRSDLARLKALNDFVHGVPAEASEVDQRSRGWDVERGYHLAIVSDKTSHDQWLAVCEEVWVVGKSLSGWARESVHFNWKW